MHTTARATLRASPIAEDDLRQRSEGGGGPGDANHALPAQADVEKTMSTAQPCTIALLHGPPAGPDDVTATVARLVLKTCGEQVYVDEDGNIIDDPTADDARRRAQDSLAVVGLAGEDGAAGPGEAPAAAIAADAGRSGAHRAHHRRTSVGAGGGGGAEAAAAAAELAHQLRGIAEALQRLEAAQERMSERFDRLEAQQREMQLRRAVKRPQQAAGVAASGGGGGPSTSSPAPAAARGGPRLPAFGGRAAAAGPATLQHLPASNEGGAAAGGDDEFDQQEEEAAPAAEGSGGTPAPAHSERSSAPRRAAGRGFM